MQNFSREKYQYMKDPQFETFETATKADRI